MRILIAEDEAVSARSLEAAVKPLGEPERACNGEECFQKFCSALEAGRPFDLIFLDLMMPDFDGHEALAAIRDVEERYGVAPGAGVKVIVTSAHTDSQNLYQAHLSGCNEYLAKPINHADLRRALRKLGFDIPEELYN